MKKLFTLAAAVLASFSLWADPVFKDSWSDLTRVGETDYYYTYLTSSDYASYISAGWMSYTGASTGSTTLRIDPATDEAISGSSATYGKVKNNGSRYMEFYVTGITSIKFYFANSGSSDRRIQYILNDGEATDLVTVVQKTSDAASIDLDAKTKNTIRIFSPDNDVYVCALKVIAPPSCEDPEFTVSPTEGTGFVGDPIEITISTKNQSKPVNFAITVDGVAGEYGTDYTFSVSTGLVQATPLRAGTFKITFSQASDGTYCDAEETATFVISEKAAVTSFEVEGPEKARLGDEVTLTATNFNAAPTRVWWLNSTTGEQIHEGATYTFTASEYGTFEYYVLARNDFNDPDEESYDYAFGVFGSVEITVGTDASLSDLKVNGATIEGFDATVLEYNLELGVYEALKVEATPTDAPYATAEVVDNNEGKVTITVTAQNTHTQEYVINYTRAAKTELVSISESTTWDWADAGSVTPEFKDATMPTRSEEFNFADVLINPAESFNAAALAGIAQFANRGEYFQGNMAKFNTTVAGTVVVTYSNTGGNRPYRHVKVNETMSAEGSANQDKKETEAIAVAAGDVEITFYIPDATQPQSRDGDVEGPSMGRIYKIVFTATPGAGIDNTEATVKAVKVVRDGQLLIQKNGVLYNAQGAIVK